MASSQKIRRRERMRRRSQYRSKLHLVSLMDIFTILVFFLLLNSSDVEVLQNDKTITLPESVAKQRPVNTTVILVNSDGIRFSGQSLVTMETLMARDDESIAELAEALTRHAANAGSGDEVEAGAVTIMGDEAIPYIVLKRIIRTCAEASYRDISLAVSQVAATPVAGTPAAGVRTMGES
jgi:biopolymer transport protein ExbD